MRLRTTRLICRLSQSAWGKIEGSEIVEFAVSVPLLVLLVVGVYDFGSAFTLRHKLSAAVLEGARVATAQVRPLEFNNSCGAPTSVCVIRDVVHGNLAAGNVDDCALNTVNASYTAGTFTWTFTGTCSGPTLRVERDALNPNAGHLVPPFDTQPYRIENTKITLIYPYKWQYNQAFKLFNRNANFLSSTITVSAAMQNLE